MLRPLVLTIAAATLLFSGPAMARQNCNLNDNLPGLKIEFGFSVGGNKSRGDGDSFDQEVVKMELRKRGVDARSVSLASDGCVEAFVQYPDGTWHSDYYDPDTWEQVD